MAANLASTQSDADAEKQLQMVAFAVATPTVKCDICEKQFPVSACSAISKILQLDGEIDVQLTTWRCKPDNSLHSRLGRQFRKDPELQAGFQLHVTGPSLVAFFEENRNCFGDKLITNVKMQIEEKETTVSKTKLNSEGDWMDKIEVQTRFKHDPTQGKFLMDKQDHEKTYYEDNDRGVRLYCVKKHTTAESSENEKVTTKTRTRHAEKRLKPMLGDKPPKKTKALKNGAATDAEGGAIEDLPKVKKHTPGQTLRLQKARLKVMTATSDCRTLIEHAKSEKLNDLIPSWCVDDADLAATNAECFRARIDALLEAQTGAVDGYLVADMKTALAGVATSSGRLTTMVAQAEERTGVGEEKDEDPDAEENDEDPDAEKGDKEEGKKSDTEAETIPNGKAGSGIKNTAAMNAARCGRPPKALAMKAVKPKLAMKAKAGKAMKAK